jgi:hypothetical protein
MDEESRKKEFQMIFTSECGWMRDRKTKALYFYLPAAALQDLDLLEDCLELLQEINPDLEEEMVN